MIDQKRFTENFVYLDKEVIVEIIDIFLEEYKKRLADIQRNITELDFQGLKFNAHSLKGVIANFMDPETIELSRILDERAKNSDHNGLQEIFDNLKRETASLAEELQVLRKEFI